MSSPHGLHTTSKARSMLFLVSSLPNFQPLLPSISPRQLYNETYKITVLLGAFISSMIDGLPWAVCFVVVRFYPLLKFHGLYNYPALRG